MLRAGLVDPKTSPNIFGVSGYSGAGTKPSPKNDPAKLTDNLMPYSLTGHMHEREVSRHLPRAGEPFRQGVHFMPHVAPFFRGITLTVNIALQKSVTLESVRDMYRQQYDNEPLIHVLGEKEGAEKDGFPLVRDCVGKHGVQVGGFTLSKDGKRLVVVATLDNLLKGAATQAMQNMNLALGFDELTSIPVSD
jgi:N-acetyl-gamma-glutamyl-phosphate reductase